MSRYATKTEVSVSSSKAEIERILERYGAEQFMLAWGADKAVIGFAMQGRQIRFMLTMPRRDEAEFTSYKRGYTMVQREESAAHRLWEQACRQRWRALALVIKAKLEAVESRIAIFEDEFMANIVLPGGRTVGEEARPMIAAAYENRSIGPLLPDYSNQGPPHD